MSSSIGEDIRRRRLAKGWSQSDLSYQARVPQPRISLIESGDVDAKASTLDKIYRALGVKLPWPKGRYLASLLEPLAS